MAVVDNTLYRNTTNIPIDAVAVAGQGGGTLDIVAKIPMLSTDDSGSIYRICEVPSNFIPVSGEITCSALTTLTDVDLGLYETPEHGGAVIDVNALADALDFSSALVPGSGLSPISAVTIGDQNKSLYLLANDGSAVDVSSERQTYTLALTTNANCDADGTVILRLKLVRREYAAA